MNDRLTSIACVELAGVRNTHWELARTGPNGLERVSHCNELEDGVHRMLETVLAVNAPGGSRLKLRLELYVPEGVVR